MIDIRDHGGSYGAGIAKNIPMDLGSVNLVKSVSTVWRTQTGATPVMDFNDMKYNKVTNEIFVLGYNTRKITVVDADTGTIKRTVTLPSASSTYEVYGLSGILISDTGRVYLSGWDNSNKGTVTEINPSNGAKIKTVKTSESTTSGSLHAKMIFEIHGGRIFFAYGGNVNIDEFDFNLNLLKSTSILGQLSRKNGIVISLENNRGVTTSEYNPWFHLFDYSPYLQRTRIDLSTGPSSCIAGFIGDKLVVVDGLDLKFYNLFGTLIKTIVQPKVVGGEYDGFYVFTGYKMMIKNIGKNIGVVSHSSNARQFVYIDSDLMEIVTMRYAEDGLVSNNSYGADVEDRFDIIDNQRIAIPRYGVYGVYRASQKLV